MLRECKCEGFEDCWDQRSESHYTRTIHDEDCPNNPQNWDLDFRPEDDDD